MACGPGNAGGGWEGPSHVRFRAMQTSREAVQRPRARRDAEQDYGSAPGGDPAEGGRALWSLASIPEGVWGHFDLPWG